MIDNDNNANADSLISKATNAMNCSDWKEAALHWARLRTYFPDNEIGYIEGTVALRNNGQFDEADDVMDQAIEGFGERDYLLLIRADTARDRNDWLIAAQRFSHFRSLYPDDLKGALGEIESLFTAGELSKAMEVNEEALKFFGRKAELVLWQIKISQALANYDLTETLYNELFQVLEKQPVTLFAAPDVIQLELKNISEMVVYIKQAQNDCGVESQVISNQVYKKHIKSIKKQKSKVIISSVPKAGTHLLSQILTAAGYPFNGLFINGHDCVLELEENFGANRVYQYQDAPLYPKEFINQLNINTQTALSLLRPGEHCMCHLPFKMIPAEWIDCIKFIAIFRNPKDSLVSEFLTEHTLYHTQKPYHYDKEIEYILSSGLPLEKMFEVWLIRFSKSRFLYYKDMLNWTTVDSALCVSYEELLGTSRHNVVKKIIKFIDSNIDIPVNLILDVFENKNPTRNTNIINKNNLWTETATKTYQDVGFLNIQNKLQGK